METASSLLGNYQFPTGELWETDGLAATLIGLELEECDDGRKLLLGEAEGVMKHFSMLMQQKKVTV